MFGCEFEKGPGAGGGGSESLFFKFPLSRSHPWLSYCLDSFLLSYLNGMEGGGERDIGSVRRRKGVWDVDVGEVGGRWGREERVVGRVGRAEESESDELLDR